MKKILDIDPHTGIKTFHEYDHSSGKTYISQEQDCESILEHNKRAQNSRSSIDKKGDYYHFARVPLTVVMKWKQDYNIDVFNDDDMPKVERLLASNEYRYLRTVDKI